MKFEIKHRFNGSILFTMETESIRLALEAAVKSGAYLRDAYLDGADLRGAHLDGADLRGADLRGAKIRDGIEIKQAPIQVIGLTWFVIIWDAHMQIGCEFHSHAEWRKFTKAEWVKMGGKDADKFRIAHKAAIMALCDSHAANVKDKP